MKRVLTFILVLSMIFGSIGMSFADTADSATYAEKAIAELVELKLVEGDEGGLRLEDAIKRSEVAVFAARLAGLEDIAKSSNYQGIFSDVTPAMWDNPVMNGAINVAAGKGFVKGYPDGTFLPSNDITNAEIITIMVRLAVSAEEAAELDKGVWPAAYVTKAAELGLLEGVSIANYGEAATRETVFVLGYNAYTDKVSEDYYVFKALVLENERVERIGSGRVVVEVIREVQKASFAEESRKEKEKGDQLRLDLPEKYDVEDLLGKVIDISLDKNEKIVKIDVDKSYDYLTDKVVATRDKLTVGKTTYTVQLGERYDKDDERVFRTYLNNAAMQYRVFADDFKGAEFARVTVKNGKVIFVDAFNFDDIAPVVKTTDKAITVLDDEASASNKELALKDINYVINFKDNNFTIGDKKDIAINEVVHYFGKTVLVRKDAKIEDIYKRVRIDKVDSVNTTNIYLKDQKDPFALSFDKARKAIYTTDYKDYKVITTERTADNLDDFKDKDVIVLVDMNDKVQFIGAEVQKLTFMALIDDILSRDVKLAKQDGRTDRFTVTFDSKLTRDGSTRTKKIADFDVSELVNVKVNEDNEIVEMEAIEFKANQTEQTVNKITKDYITIVGTDYRIARDTIIFVDSGRVRKAMTIEKLIEDYKTTVSSTDKNAPSGIEVSFLTVAGDLDVVIFTAIEAKADYNTSYLKVDRIYKSGRNYTILAYDQNGKEFEFPVAKENDKNLDDAYTLVHGNKVKEGDIIKASLTKTDNPEIAKIEVVIPYGDKVVEIYKVEESGSKLTFVDRDGKQAGTYYLSRNAQVFDGPLSRGKKVEFKADGDYITYISVTTAKLTGEKVEKLPENVYELKAVDINKNEVFINGKWYSYVGDITKLVPGKNYKLTMLGDRAQLELDEEDSEDPKVTPPTGVDVGKAVPVDGKENTKAINATYAAGATLDGLKIEVPAGVEGVKINGKPFAGVDEIVAKLGEKEITATFKDGVVTFSGDATIASYVAEYGKKITVEYDGKTYEINLEAKEAEIVAEAELVGTLLGVESYAISIEGAELKDVQKVLVNDDEKIFEIKDGVVRVNSGSAVTSIKIVVSGKTIDVTIK